MGQIILAYHGCDITTRDHLVSGATQPRVSKNSYDWLYDGMYFFEGDHERALKLAKAAADRESHSLTRQPIVTPAVVGAVLDVDRMFDLSTQLGISYFKAASETLKSLHEKSGEPLPQNTAGFEGDTEKTHRAFDREVCKLVHLSRRAVHFQESIQAAEIVKSIRELGESATDADFKGLDLANKAVIASAPFQASRGAYEQGQLIDDSGSIYDDTHLQIAVHDLSCIRAWFLVQGDKLLSAKELSDADAALAAAKAARTARKPRRSPTKTT